MFEIIVAISFLIGIIIALIDFYKTLKSERRFDKAVKQFHNSADSFIKSTDKYLNKKEKSK